MALAGLRVLELGTVISAPYCGLLLAESGAEVIKIELASGDPYRGPNPLGAASTSFQVLNRGKKSVTIDLSTEEGKSTVVNLVLESDVLIENMRPGTLDRHGLGPDHLRSINPKLVYCSISGMGDGGPDRDRPGYDPIAMAVSGLWSQMSSLSAPEPVGPPIADLLTGVLAAQRVLAAFIGAQRTGHGSRVYASLLGSALSLQMLATERYQSEGEIPDELSRARHSQSFGFIAGDGRPFAVHLSSRQKFWLSLIDAIEHPELAKSADFKSATDRIRNYSQLHAALSSIFSTMDRDHWLKSLVQHDVPAAPINNLAEGLADPQVAFVTSNERDQKAELGPAPALGEHNYLLKKSKQDASAGGKSELGK